MRPAAYAISLWLFSSSTSNIALGRAWETTASMTTACSFSWPGVVTRFRACRRGPRRGVDDLAKTAQGPQPGHLLGQQGLGQLRLPRLEQGLALERLDLQQAAGQPDGS